MVHVAEELKRSRSAAVAALVLAAAGCHGQVIRHELAPNHPADFDFARPPCSPRARPSAEPGDVLVRYLGVSGVLVEWRGVALLSAPFFSHYGPWRVLCGKIDWDEDAIDAGMTGNGDAPIEVVLAGHSHYDHIGDLPPVVERWAPRASILVNRTGRNLLERCPGVAQARFVDVEAAAGTWIRPAGSADAPLPLRVMPIESGHARQLALVRLAGGEVRRPRDCFDGKRIAGLEQGRPFAFLVDLLDGERIAFRIHLQDAAADRGQGFPSAAVLEERPVDLAVLCMPSAWHAEAYPEALLEWTAARHALVTHHEDFARDPSRPARFVATLTDARANAFLERVRAEMRRETHVVRAPRDPACGPSDAAWSMPLRGEWLRFASGASASERETEAPAGAAAREALGDRPAHGEGRR